MPIQAPQWTDYLNCPACCREFAPSRSPISLGCGHTLCRLCLKNLHRKQCPFDQTVISVDLDELVVNTALLQLAGYSPPAQPYQPPSIQLLSEQDRHAYDAVVKSLEQLAVFLKYCGNANNVPGSRLSRPMQRKLVTLLQCAMTDEEGRGKAARAARSLGDRTVTELIVQHQNPQQLSANLWAAVRSRGCQFLGPAMQEEVLKLVLLALEDGSALSRKVLVMFVVQRLEPHFPQASKTSIGHVVQLLYRASCFKVSKRVCDSSLMQLKEEFRTYESLRREHDAQIVQIATEAGLRIAPDQWSALLYGDTQHKSHMQSIIDKLQTPQSFAQSVQELFITLQRTGDPAQLIAMSIPLDRLANIDASPDAKSPTWQQLSAITTALKEVVSGLVHFMQHHANGRDNNHNPKILERLPETPTQPSSMQGLPGRYKVAMCRDAQTRTYCPRGNNCTYAHSEEELERYRRINSAVNNQFMPPMIVTRPIYQRFSVPPPPLPTMENNYNMPPMQQQISPSPRRPMVGVEAMDHEQPYEHEREKVFELTREPTHEHPRERSFEHREQPYDMAREQPYDISRETSFERTREPPYDITREHYDISREQYDISREQYDITREQYDITREQSYERAREPPFDHPPPNVSADNYAASYANALLHGGTDSMARSATQSTNQNGNVNTMLPPPGRYYPRYVGRPAYPYMAPIDARINNDEMSQYQGMGSGIRPAPNHDYSGIEYPQQPYIDENGPEMHFDNLSFGISASRPLGIAHTQPQDAAWPTNNPVKCPPMFKFDERAKNLPIGMEIGKSMPIGMEMPKNMPIGREMKNNMAIGMDMGNNMAIGMDMGNNMAIGMDMGNNIPIGMEMPKNMAIGREMKNNMAIGMDMGNNNPIGMEMPKNMAIGNAMVTINMPIGMDIPKNMPIGIDMQNNMPIGMDLTGNKPIGMEMANNMSIGMPQTNGDMIHHGLERKKPKLRTVNEKRDDQELEKELKALEKRMSTEFSKVDTDVVQQAQH